MLQLKGKRALVTGGSRGIGASIALALADEGADVVISYERSADRAREIVDQIEGKGRRARATEKSFDLAGQQQSRCAPLLAYARLHYPDTWGVPNASYFSMVETTDHRPAHRGALSELEGSPRFSLGRASCRLRSPSIRSPWP